MKMIDFNLVNWGDSKSKEKFIYVNPNCVVAVSPSDRYGECFVYLNHTIEVDGELQDYIYVADSFGNVVEKINQNN